MGAPGTTPMDLCGDRPAGAGLTVQKAGVAWAVMWESRNALDGHRCRFMYENRVPALFRTRAEARAWISATHGYIARRRDLRREPHGWRVPRAVRVNFCIEAA